MTTRKCGPRLRDQRGAFFRDPELRCGASRCRPPARLLDLPGETLIDWGGALRWTKTGASPATVRDAAARLGGHTMLFRHGDRSGSVYHPLSPGLDRLHRRLKDTFDPKRLLNRGRMYPDW